MIIHFHGLKPLATIIPSLRDFYSINIGDRACQSIRQITLNSEGELALYKPKGTKKPLDQSRYNGFFGYTLQLLYPVPLQGSGVLLSFHILRIIILLIRTRNHIIKPFLVGEVPIYSFFQSFFELKGGFPAQFALKLR